MLMRFHRKSSLCRLAAAGALLAAITFPVSAQSEKATLRGTVADPSGGVVAGASVVVTDRATGIEARRTLTDSNGNYEMPDMKPASYRVSVSFQGFKTFDGDNVLLDPGQVRRVDVRLDVGATSESVVVTAGAALIQTDTGTISTQIDNGNKYATSATVDIYPSPLALVAQTPGMQGNGWGMVMNGIPSGNKQTWAMDGVAGDTGSGGGGGDTAQMDNANFFETVEVTSANAGVDASRPAGFNMVSKHGANAFHGAASWKEINSALNARKFFDPRNTPYILREAEAEAGGPILKNRTFFFVGWMHQVVPLGAYIQSSVPTAQMRAGDFSFFLNPATSPNGKATIIKDPTTNTPFPNNQIPQNRINSVSQAYLQYYPLPNTGGPTTYSQNYGWNDLYPAYKTDFPYFRIDHQLTQNNNLYVRWIGRFNPFPMTSGPDAQFDYTEERDDHQTAVSDTWVLSRSLDNSFTFGYTSEHIMYGVSYPGEQQPLYGDDVVQAIGLQGVNSGNLHTIGFPNISISGVGSVTTLSHTSGCVGGPGGTCSANSIHSFKDSLTWAHGAHVFKFGGEFDHFTSYSGTISTAIFGSTSFSGTYTGSGFADFLLGIPSSSSRLNNPLIDRNAHQYQGGLFAGDTFKVTPRLNIDYGVRWDYFSLPVYNDGLMYNMDLSTGNIIVPGGTLSKVSALYPKNITVVEGDVVPSPKMTNIRPRISAAYRLSAKMVLRGGYGEFTDGGDYFGRLNSAGPFQLSESYNNVMTNGVPLFAFPNPFPGSLALSTVASQSVTAMPIQNNEGVIRQFNVTLERQVGTLGVRASFLGMTGSGMNYSLNINKPQASTTPYAASRNPYPQFNSVSEYRDDGSWRREALQLEVQKRTGAVTFNWNFTWANNMENWYGTQNPYNVTSQWERDGTERRVSAVFSGTWALPVGRGRHYLANTSRTVNGVLGGWDLQVAASLESGQYVSPSFTGPDPANASAGNVTQLPDCIGDAYSGTRNINQWWNLGAFAAPPAGSGRYGNCGVNTLETYPIRVANASVMKSFQVTERIKSTFLVQASDLTNTPTFQSVNTNITQANFGKYTSVFPYYMPERAGFRQVALKLRVTW